MGQEQGERAGAWEGGGGGTRTAPHHDHGHQFHRIHFKILYSMKAS